jgi:hypothetical protein
MEPRHSAGHDVGLVYTEKRCALRWPRALTCLLSIAAGAILALICIVLTLTTSKVFALAVAVAAVWTVYWTRLLRSTWRTGMRVDEAGIRIGDVRALPFASSRSYSVFACSWAAVRGIVVSDRASPGGLPRRPPGAPGDGGHRPWRAVAMLARLLMPFGSAVLAIYVDPDAAGAPQVQDVDNVHGFGTPARVWLASTRRPKALRAALAQVPGCPPVADSFGPDAMLPPG